MICINRVSMLRSHRYYHLHAERRVTCNVNSVAPPNCSIFLHSCAATLTDNAENTRLNSIQCTNQMEKVVGELSVCETIATCS